MRRSEQLRIERRSLRVPIAAVAMVLTLLVGLVLSMDSEASARTEALSLAERTELEARAELSTVRVAGRACPGVIMGSGFVIDDLLLTARHLVRYDDQIKVDSPGLPVIVPVLGASPELDLAIAPAEFLVAVPLELAEKAPLAGETVVVSGHPDGAGLRVTGGAEARYGSAAEWGVPGDRVLLVETDIRKGFSGGPVLNRDGDVVGLVVGLDTVTGLAVAIPVDELAGFLTAAEGSSRSELFDVHAADSCGR